tara:strand:- start:932 stop:2242 length:1311 start_codon:yes stop_codon:yes gene_type:complete
MSNKIKNQFFLYLLFLTPFLFTIGIAVLELSVLFLILFFLYKNRNLDLYKDKKVLFLFFFSIYVAVNAFFQIHDNLKISSFFFFRYTLLSLSIYFTLNYLNENLNKDNKKILLIIGFIFLGIFFDSYLQFFTGENLFGYKIIQKRISSLFGSELILGTFLFKLLPLCLFLLLFVCTNKELEKYSKILTFFLCLYFTVIYIAGGRTAFFLMLMFIFFIIFFINNLRKIFSISILFLTIFIFFTSIFDMGKSDPFNRVFIKTFNQITNNIYLDKQDNISFKKEINKTNKGENLKNFKIFSYDHNGHYVLAYNLFKENPIFGIGPKGFRYFCRSVEYNPKIGVCSTHPHNFLMQILTETGFVGLIFYFYGLFFVIMNIYKVFSKNTLTNEKNNFLIISIGLILIFFPFIPNGNFFNNWISIINFYYIGIYLYSYKKVFL